MGGSGRTMGGCDGAAAYGEISFFLKKGFYMNGTLRVVAATENTQYEYKTQEILVYATLRKDVVSNEVREFSGQVHVLSGGMQGDFIGSFNGYMRDGVMKYSLSEMSRQQSNKVWDAIDDMEPEVITPTGVEN